MARFNIYSLVFFICFACTVDCKVNKHALTESMGQEVIEIGGPVKELPPDLEEEPSAEVDDTQATSTTLSAATQAVQAKGNLSKSRSDAIDAEARIEKELADLYKDTDYKADSGEVTSSGDKVSTSPADEVSASPADDVEKPIGRSRKVNFEVEDNGPPEGARVAPIQDQTSGANQFQRQMTFSKNAETVESAAGRLLTTFILCLLSVVIIL